MHMTLEHPVPTPAPAADEREARRRARSVRRQVEAAGRMDPELRYRVLLSILKMETDFLDLADKKARFALVIMSALNAAVVVVAMKGSAGIGTNDIWGWTLSGIAGLYAAATLYYIWAAIESLRPRGQRGRCTANLPTTVEEAASMRVLFHVDIAKRDRQEFRDLWSELRLDNVTTELADQLHLVSSINVLKFSALERLYRGVGVMTVLLTAFFLVEGLRRFAGS